MRQDYAHYNFSCLNLYVHILLNPNQESFIQFIVSIFVLTRKYSGTLPPTLFSLFLALYAQNHPTEKLQEEVKRNFPSWS